MENQSNTTVVWCGSLAILLNRLQKKLFKITNARNDINDRIKRLGVYYMCIDDLPL